MGSILNKTRSGVFTKIARHINSIQILASDSLSALNILDYIILLKIY